MEKISSLYERKYHIDLREIDFTRKLKLSTLFGYFQDIASLAAEELGFGIETLEKKFGVAWVLTRVRVEIIRMPLWDEEITVETWPLDPSKIEFERDYVVKDADGNIIIRAVSKWIIMDIQERKLKRSELIGFHYPPIQKERALEGPLGKLKNFGTLEPVYNKVIGYSDIDFNGHLNNSKYVDFIMDCFPVDSHKNYILHSLDLQFNHEALPGETITLFKDTSRLEENLIYIEGSKEESNQVVFKAEVSIAPVK